MTEEVSEWLKQSNWAKNIFYYKDIFYSLDFEPYKANKLDVSEGITDWGTDTFIDELRS